MTHCLRVLCGASRARFLAGRVMCVWNRLTRPFASNSASVTAPTALGLRTSRQLARWSSRCRQTTALVLCSRRPVLLRDAQERRPDGSSRQAAGKEAEVRHPQLPRAYLRLCKCMWACILQARVRAVGRRDGRAIIGVPLQASTRPCTRVCLFGSRQSIGH